MKKYRIYNGMYNKLSIQSGRMFEKCYVDRHFVCLSNIVVGERVFSSIRHIEITQI